MANLSIDVKDSEARADLADLEDYVEGIAPVSLSITENGTYTAPTGVFGYSPVSVNVASGLDYSTTEQNTGRKWIDGKPIYRKTYVKTAMGEYPNELPANFETMINVESALKYTGETTIITPIYATGNYDYFGAYFSNSTLILRDTHTSTATGVTIIISIYYTKTTDTAE